MRLRGPTSMELRHLPSQKELKEKKKGSKADASKSRYKVFKRACPASSTHLLSGPISVRALPWSASGLSSFNHEAHLLLCMSPSLSRHASACLDVYVRRRRAIAKSLKTLCMSSPGLSVLGQLLLPPQCLAASTQDNWP